MFVIQVTATCIPNKWRHNNLYLFHLFGIHVLSEFSFPLFPLTSSRMHIDPEIFVSLVPGTSETSFFEIRPYFIIFSLFGILMFTKLTLSVVSATSDVLSFLSAHGVLNCICFTCSGYMCYRNCPFPCSHLFLVGCILIPKYLFYLFEE